MNETRESCSFCHRSIGETWSDRIQDSRITFVSHELSVADRERMIETIRGQHKVRLLLPGPRDLRICNVCVALYAEAVRRELSVMDP